MWKEENIWFLGAKWAESTIRSGRWILRWKRWGVERFGLIFVHRISRETPFASRLLRAALRANVPRIGPSTMPKSSLGLVLPMVDIREILESVKRTGTPVSAEFLPLVYDETWYRGRGRHRTDPLPDMR
jgi:hypothetical protein